MTMTGTTTMIVNKNNDYDYRYSYDKTFLNKYNKAIFIAQNDKKDTKIHYSVY